MRWLLAVLLLTQYAAVHAEVYRWVQPDGTVIYSDQPHAEAEEIKLPGIQTYKSPRFQPSSSQDDDSGPTSEKTQGYTKLAIQQPANDATIRDNTGNVVIQLSIEPPLQTDQNHKISVTLDNKAFADTFPSPLLSLQNLDRGTHTLQTSIVDANGKTLITSNTVTFHMKRESALLRKKIPE